MVTYKQTTLLLLEEEKRSGHDDCWCKLVQLDMNNRCPISIEVLIADSKLLGFNLLLRFDAIKKLGCLWPVMGLWAFYNMTDLCAQPLPSMRQTKMIWVVSWKWTSNQPPVTLKKQASRISCSSTASSCRLG